MANKKIYIGIGSGIITLTALFLILNNLGLILTSDGDKYCGDVCISYITVKNPTSQGVSIYNLNGTYVSFSPEIINYKLYEKSSTGKWIYKNLSKKINSSVLSFPAYRTKEFKLIGYKKPEQTIKWSFGSLDPLWMSNVTSEGLNYSVQLTTGSFLIKPNASNGTFEPENQTSTIGIYNITNYNATNINMTVTLMNASPRGITLYVNNVYNSSNATALNTSSYMNRTYLLNFTGGNSSRIINFSTNLWDNSTSLTFKTNHTIDVVNLTTTVIDIYRIQNLFNNSLSYESLYLINTTRYVTIPKTATIQSAKINISIEPWLVP